MPEPPDQAEAKPAPSRRCPRCGRVLEHRLGNLCPACAWQTISDGVDGLGEEGAEAVERVEPGPISLLRLPGYRVVQEVARGGMGIVYRAEQFDPARTVALKMMLPHQLGSLAMRERFRTEMRVNAGLEHPSILPVYHVGEWEGMPYFSMKFARGGTLADRLARYQGQYREIAQLLATVADAVHYAHERGVLHRDLKPANILFDESDHPYVSDFGLAKFMADDSSLTQSVHVLGTPQYFSPEIAAGSVRDATTAGDVYAVGAILYELLAGQPPFRASSLGALLKEIAEKDPPPIARKSSAVAPVPADLDVICRTCLAKDPAARYASAAALAADLRRWLRGEPIEARPVAALGRLWAWCRRNPSLSVVSALLVLAVVGGGLALVQSHERLKAALAASETAKAALKQNLYDELLTQIRVRRRNGYDGKPREALTDIARAMALGPTADLQTEAIAALGAGASDQPIMQTFPEAQTDVRQACSLDVSPDGRWLLTGTVDGLSLWPAEPGPPVWEWPQIGLPWMHVFFHPAQTSILSSSRLFGVEERSWRVESSGDGRTPTVKVGPPTRIGPAFECSLVGVRGASNDWIVARERDPIYIVRYEVWPGGNPKNARTLVAGRRMTWISVSDDGRWVATTTRPAADVLLWDGLKGAWIRELGEPTAMLRQFSPDGRWLLTRSPTAFQLWQVGSWDPGPRWPMPDWNGLAMRMPFSKDGRWLIVPVSAHQVQVRRASDYAAVWTLTLPESVVLVDAIWAPDGQYLYLLDRLQRLYRWDLARVESELAKLGLATPTSGFPPRL